VLEAELLRLVEGSGPSRTPRRLARFGLGRAQRVERPLVDWERESPAEFVARAAADPLSAVSVAARVALACDYRDPRGAAILFTLLAADQRRGLAVLLDRQRSGLGFWKPVRSHDVAELLLDGLVAEAGERVRTRLLVLYTLHPSGFMRETALVHLAPTSNSEVLRFLAPRPADWVPAVRTAALRAFEAWLSPLHARALLDAYPELLRARGRAHFAAATLVERCEALLRSQARTGLFLERLEHADREAQRTTYCFALETEGEQSLSDVIARAFATGDPVCTRAALAALPRLAHDAERAALTDEAARSRWTATRRLAATAAAQHLVERRSILNRLLVDRSASVRAAARYADDRDASERLAFLVAEANSGGDSADGAVLALADLGDCSLVNRVRRWLEDPRPRRARAAVRALRGMIGREAIPELRGLLHRPCVSVAVASGLVALDAEVTLDEVQELLGRGGPAHTRATRELSLLLGPRDELDLFLALHEQRRTALAGDLERWAQGRLGAWLKRTNSPIEWPDVAFREQLAQRVRAATSLPAEQREELLWRLAPPARGPSA